MTAFRGSAALQPPRQVSLCVGLPEAGGGAMLEKKRTGTELGMKGFAGRDGNRYLVFRTLDGSFHTFVEVEAKQAARECGAAELANTRQMWESLWEKPA